MLALIRHIRSRRAAGMEISPEELALRFGLDAFVTRKLVDSELERHPNGTIDIASCTRETREMTPATGSGLD
jgi:hypothetical protein